MNGILEANQTSGNVWGIISGGRMYHYQETNCEPERQIQPPILLGLDVQIARFEAGQQQFIDQIRKLYVIEQSRSVLDYLWSDRRLPHLLVDAAPQLRNFIGDAVVALQMSSDENGWRMLYAIVRWRGGPLDALAALDGFDNSWWLAHSYPAGANLAFTYELV